MSDEELKAYYRTAKGAEIAKYRVLECEINAKLSGKNTTCLSASKTDPTTILYNWELDRPATEALPRPVLGLLEDGDQRPRDASWKPKWTRLITSQQSGNPSINQFSKLIRLRGVLDLLRSLLAKPCLNAF